MRRRCIALLLGSAAATSIVVSPALSQEPTAAELEQQITALQAQLRSKRVAEARAALAAEAEAARKAAEARTYLASIGELPQPGPATGTPSAAGSAASQPMAPPPPPPAPPPPPPPPPSGKQKFGGIDFGVGIAFSYDLGRNDRIQEAELVNGIVRVTRSDNVRARMFLETHYFFTPTREDGVERLPIFGLENTQTEKTWGWGPFIALQPGSDSIIDAIGAGFMIGLRRAGEGNEGKDSFNIGLGVLYDLDTKILGDGIVENQPLPTGETEIRFKRRDQSGLLVLSSYSF